MTCNNLVPLLPTYPTSRTVLFINSHCTPRLYCCTYGVLKFGSTKIPLTGTPTKGASGESTDGIVETVRNDAGGGSGTKGSANVRSRPGKPTPKPRYGKLKSCVLI